MSNFESNGEKTLKAIKEDILKNKWSVKKITTRNIMSSYSVGMNIAREVLHKLVATKDIIYKPNSGFVLNKYNPIKVIRKFNQLNKFSEILVTDILENFDPIWASQLGKHPSLMRILLNKIDINTITEDDIYQLKRVNVDFFMDAISNTGEENIEMYRNILFSQSHMDKDIPYFMENPKELKEHYNNKLINMENACSAIMEENKKDLLDVYREAIKYDIKWHMKHVI